MPDTNTTNQAPATLPATPDTNTNNQSSRTPQEAMARLIDGVAGVARNHPLAALLAAVVATNGERVVEVGEAAVELIDEARPEITAAYNGVVNRVTNAATNATAWVQARVQPYWNNRDTYYRQGRDFLITWFVVLMILGVVGDLARYQFDGVAREATLYVLRVSAFLVGVWGLVRVVPALAIVRAAIYALLAGMAGVHSIFGDTARSYARQMGVYGPNGELLEDKANAAVSQLTWHLVLFFILMPALLIASPSLILFSGMMAIISLLGVILVICLARGWAVLGGYVWALRIVYSLVIGVAIMTLGNMIAPGFFGPMIESMRHNLGYFQAFWNHGPIDYFVESITGAWIKDGATDVFIDNTPMKEEEWMLLLTPSQRITGVLMTLGIITAGIFVIVKLRYPVLGMLPYNTDAARKIQEVWAEKAVRDARKEAGLPVLPEHQMPTSTTATTTPATPATTTPAAASAAAAVNSGRREGRGEWVLGILALAVLIGGCMWGYRHFSKDAGTNSSSTSSTTSTQAPAAQQAQATTAKPTKTVANNAKPTRTVTVPRTPASPATTDCSQLIGDDAKKTCEQMNEIIRGN